MTFNDVLAADNAALFDPDLLGMPGASVETVDYERNGSTLASGISITMERGDISRAKAFRAGDVSPQTAAGIAYISAALVEMPVYQDKIKATDADWTVLEVLSTDGGIHEVSIESGLAPRF